MNAHLKRWITGLIAGPIVLVLILYGSETLFALFITALIMGAVVEFGRMAYGKGSHPEKNLALLPPAAIALTAWQNQLSLMMATTALSIIMVWLFFLLAIRRKEIDIAPLGKMLVGSVAIPVLLSHLILIREREQGLLWIMFLVVLAFSGDTVAFYTGRTLGRRKLFPEVSPAKTVEGAIGSVVGSMSGCILFKLFYLPALPAVHLVAMSLVGNILGQLGDLSESAIKRAYGTKDSGSIFPGHGGILDRLDFFLFSSPFIFYYRVFVIS
ncbi:MAG: phosphatidate cytidylyltransferase [Syntrophales bacterium]